MAMRFVALLIPLAITLPQLQMSRPKAPEPHPPTALSQPAFELEVAEDKQLAADTAQAHAVLAPPRQDAMRTTESARIDASVADAPVVVAVAPAVRKASPTRATARVVRASSPVQLVAAPGRVSARHAKGRLSDDGCLPNAHCAPVVVAKVKPVIRRPQ